MKRIGLADARDTLSSLVNDVAHGRQRIVIESRGHPKAVIVGLEDLDRLERIDAERPGNPMLRWLDESEQLLRRQPRVPGSPPDDLPAGRDGAVGGAGGAD